MDNFLKRKKDILSRADKSFKKKWDKKILRLCMKINFSDNYYTTSSCSGRAVLMLDEDKKQEGLFIKIYHDGISLKELKRDLDDIRSLVITRSQIDSSKQTSPCFSLNKSVNMKDSLINSNKSRANFSEQANTPRAYPETFSSKMFTKGIKFKMEPCILHVACRDFNCAQKLFDKAKFAGWKKSGIIATRNHIMLELNSTEKLEFPIISDGEVLVGDKFLKLIVKETNKKLEKSWEKIEKLEGMIK